MVGTYEALLWLCEWNLGEQRGKRAKGEQTGSLNRVFFTDLRPFSRILGLFRDLGPFWGFGAFSGIWGLFRGFGTFFGDSWPFRGFAAFFGDSWPFLGICGLFADLRPFRRFVAFSQICGLFADLRPFRRFAAFLQIRGFTAKGAKGANEPPGETFATWYFEDCIYTLRYHCNTITRC